MGEKNDWETIITRIFSSYRFREEYMKPRLGSELSFVCTCGSLVFGIWITTAVP
jgi:hypothetical protein